MIYAVRAADGTGPVKIGFTARKIETRVKSLQSGSPIPLVCIAVMEGTQADEAAIHRRLSTWRDNGEWFRWHGDVPVFVDSMTPYAMLPVSLKKRGRTRISGTKREQIERRVRQSENGCWEWPTVSTAGVCIFHWHEGNRARALSAPRVVYEEYVGPVPRGGFVVKICGNARCVCPEHLRVTAHAPGPYSYRPQKERRLLTLEQVAEIRACAGSESIRSMERRMGITRASIRKILRRSTYRETP